MWKLGVGRTLVEEAGGTKSCHLSDARSVSRPVWSLPALKSSSQKVNSGWKVKLQKEHWEAHKWEKRNSLSLKKVNSIQIEIISKNTIRCGLNFQKVYLWGKVKLRKNLWAPQIMALKKWKVSENRSLPKRIRSFLTITIASWCNPGLWVEL